MKAQDGNGKGPGLIPSRWEPHFRKAGIQAEEINGARSAQAKATLLGNFLAKNQGREVPIQVGDRSGRARLRASEGRPRRYFFEIAWDGPAPAKPGTSVVGLDDGLEQVTPGDPGATLGPRVPVDGTISKRPL